MTKEPTATRRTIDPRMFIAQATRVAFSAEPPATARRGASMASRNAETAARIAGAFNQRDWAAIKAAVTADCVFSDPVQDHYGPEGFVDGYNNAWVSGFSDAQMTQIEIHDAGDTVVVEFVGTGTNDGSIGGLPPSGKDASQQICEVYRFDSEGKVVGGRSYYDQLGILAQLGHAE